MNKTVPIRLDGSFLLAAAIVVSYQLSQPELMVVTATRLVESLTPAQKAKEILF
jgi:hypothetical protein